MTKEEYLKILKDSFKDFVFYEDGHYYECKGKRVGISVTTFIHEFCNEFDAEGMAEKVANRDGKTIQQVLDEWAYKRDFSCEKGTTCHEYSQCLWSGETWFEKPFDFTQEYRNAVNKINLQANNFKKDYEGHLEHLIDELPISIAVMSSEQLGEDLGVDLGNNQGVFFSSPTCYHVEDAIDISKSRDEETTFNCK